MAIGTCRIPVGSSYPDDMHHGLQSRVWVCTVWLSKNVPYTYFRKRKHSILGRIYRGMKII
jgi:hypothetical protein